jgi:hypothetical protein
MNLCNLWKKNYSVCRECGVHFEPVTGADARWGYLCATHRAPVRKIDLEHDAVMAWVKDNMPKVKKLMEEEEDLFRNAELREASTRFNNKHNQEIREMMDKVKTRNNLYNQASGLSGQKPGSLYGEHERPY